ncbi:MAG: hypothetical protein EOO24_54770, partial [Comamonadaceae bacterium]
GNLSYATTGRLTNTGALLAGGTLAVSASDIDNTASGVLRRATPSSPTAA